MTIKRKPTKNKMIKLIESDTEPLMKWIVYSEISLLLIGTVFFSYFWGYMWTFSFLVGGLLVFFNFIVLSRILPSLIIAREVKASIFSLLFSFYSRLFFTAIVLLICIVFLNLPIYPMIVGLSTIVVGIICWIMRYIFTTNHKEASSYVRGSSTRIAS